MSVARLIAMAADPELQKVLIILLIVLVAVGIVYFIRRL